MNLNLIFTIIFVLLIYQKLSTTTTVSDESICRCLPQDSCWPDPESWEALNSSVSGKLIKLLPPAAPCHDPYFNQEACDEARTRWKLDFWRADQPGAMQVPNWEFEQQNTCLIQAPRTSSCSQGSVSVYAVNASEVSHVQAAVSFAAEKNLRLVIKSTGHDYLGRSTAPGSLSLWLHHLKGITVHQSFTPECCENTGYTAVTVGGGEQWQEVYLELVRRNLVVSGGAIYSVGAAGGYLQGGGHGPLSHHLGLAADNILEYRVVTADGRLLTANSCQNHDLFWALRGGGGGTFGVVVSATYRTHPALTGVVFSYYSFTANDQETFQRFLTGFLEMNPVLSDSGWTGYFYSYDPWGRYLIGYFLLPNGTVPFARWSFQPLLSFAAGLNVRVSSGVTWYKSLVDWYLEVHCNNRPCEDQESNVGNSVFLSSRLLPRSVVVTSASDLSVAFMSILQKEVIIIGHLVAGGEVSRPRNNSVLPAWRSALLHIVLSKRWMDDNSTESEKQGYAEIITAAKKPLIELTPGSGAYMNEADFNEPEWQQSFFGENYGRLGEIKRAVDPRGLFVCRHCVGSEDWSEDLNSQANSHDPGSHDYERFCW